MLQISDGRGKKKIEEGKNNMSMIRDYFIEFPESSKMDCSRELKLSYPTVLKHVKELIK